MTYRITQEEDTQPIEWPPRIKILQEEYKKATKGFKGFKLDYQPETVDLLEKIFFDRCKLKPESLKVSINAIYRVKNIRTKEEWYYYNATKTVLNTLNQPAEPFGYQGYGHHRIPIIGMKWNEARGENVPDIVSYKHGFELRMDSKEVKKFLDSSFLPCENFYVGYTGDNPNDPIATPYYQIHNKQDFLEGSFEDLLDMGRLGVSYKEQASLYMVEAARQKEKENRERALGMRQPQNKHIT